MDTHAFAQVPGVSVLVCTCGKWPLHHVHTGDRRTCTCDECRALSTAAAKSCGPQNHCPDCVLDQEEECHRCGLTRAEIGAEFIAWLDSTDDDDESRSEKVEADPAPH